MTTVAPSLLSANFLELGEELDRFKNEKNLWFHLDVMDGHFVPNLTFGTTVLKKLKERTHHPLDAHFMVSNPEDHAQWFKDFGFHNFTFHWEAVTHHDMFIKELKKLYPSVGVSLNPSTPLNSVPDYILKQLDLLLIMSVNPGFGGQVFIESSIDKVAEASSLRSKLSANFKIQVDGGVSDKNAKTLTEKGADILVAGSYIFGEPNNNYSTRIQSLRS